MKHNSKLPDPPLSNNDVPTNPCAVIPQAELVAAANAAVTFQIARADYEKKRAAVILKLLLCAEPEDGSIRAKLDRAGNLILIDSSSVGEPEVMKLTAA